MITPWFAGAVGLVIICIAAPLLLFYIVCWTAVKVAEFFGKDLS